MCWVHSNGHHRKIVYYAALPQTSLRSITFLLTYELQKEAEIYNDIIQFNFVDHYYNLTLKSMSSVRFVAKYCSKAKFIVKMDSDNFNILHLEKVNQTRQLLSQQSSTCHCPS